MQQSSLAFFESPPSIKYSFIYLFYFYFILFYFYFIYLLILPGNFTGF